MSKDNMEELQRWAVWDQNDHVEDKDGEWVRFSDVEEREARLKAHCARLTGSLQGTMELNARLEAQVERLDAECNRRVIELGYGHKESKADAFDAAYQHLRSLLDSGEEQKASEPAIYEGYGRKWEPVKGTSALREVGDTGPDWDQCVYHMIGGRVQRFLMAEREAMPSPSPALEGRGDFVGDDLSGVHTCHAECPCRESGPDPVAVPEKVEECPDWSDAEIRAAIAAFRATEEEK